MQDLESGREFYQRAFGLPVFHEDDSSTVFRFGDTLVNLLQEGEAPGLVAPAAMAPADSGVRFQLTVGVDDVDAVCAVLTAPRSRCSTRGTRPGLGLVGEVTANSQRPRRRCAS